MLEVRLFKNTASHSPFFENLRKISNIRNLILLEKIAEEGLTKPLPSPSGVQKEIYTASAQREFDGVGWWVGGWVDGVSNGSFIFLHTL